MNPQDLQAPLFQQIELLVQVLNESPYLSQEGRKKIEKEISEISEKLKEGSLPSTQGEKRLNDLDRKIAGEEIMSLMTKLGHLNPSSPRLSSLRDLTRKLGEGEISPEQARQTVHHLMQG